MDFSNMIAFFEPIFFVSMQIKIMNLVKLLKITELGSHELDQEYEDDESSVNCSWEIIVTGIPPVRSRISK